MKILIADDHDLVRETLAAYLSQQADFEIETATSLPEALDKIESANRFHLVILDYSMPGMNGLDGLSRAQAVNDPWPVAIMSGTADKAVAEEAIKAGARGFLPKTMSAASMINAVRFMSAGETFVPVSFMTADAPAAHAHPLQDKLTARELQVLEALCQGLSNKEIARELDLQEVTIKLHVKTLCRKIEAKNRTQAAMIAKDAGLF